LRIADFIFLHREAILDEWEAFAATRLPAASSMSALVLRDHGPQILDAVIKDLRTAQTADEQDAKSKGRAVSRPEAPETAAQAHAVLRARHGFDINQLAAEYRALRASVLKLWGDALDPAPTDVDDVIRFNEAIDQALAESIGHFHRQVEQARHLFMGVVSHDLRSPLNAVKATAAYLASLNAGDPISSAASRLIRSGVRMEALLNDLVEYNRVNLGLGIHITPGPCDLAAAFAEEMELLKSAHEEHRVDFEVRGDCAGSWDPMRLRQLLANLVQNAVQHGAADDPVHVRMTGADGHVLIEVGNAGRTLSDAEMQDIFEPLQRGGAAGSDDHHRHLGLGLFVVREIARAHGGDVRVRSDGNGTVFSVRIPSGPAAPAAGAGPSVRD
jgi:signal transduction histidine kinase